MSLIELLIAMVVMSVGIAAIVAGFSSGIFTTVRAARASTAGAVADKQMEAFRGLNYNSIFRASTAPGAPDPYASDESALALPSITASCGATQTYCQPTLFCDQQTCQSTPFSGASYRLDTHVNWKCPVVTSAMTGPPPTPPTCSAVGTPPVSSRAVKLVTLVVRDASNTSKSLFRESSTFDQTTG